jgi:hypothetical protein
LLRPVDAWTRLIRAVAVITTAFVGLTALGTDVWHSVLLTQLQLWRAHWVAHLLAMTLAPWLTVRLWCLGRLWPASACALALALLHGHFGLDHGIASLSLWALLSLAAWRVHEPSRAIVWLACGSTLLCLLGMSAWQLWDYLGQLAWISPETVWSGAFGKVSANPVVAAGGFAALMYIAARGRPGALAALGLSALLLFGALTSPARWSHRTPRTIPSRPTCRRMPRSTGPTSSPLCGACLSAQATTPHNKVLACFSTATRRSSSVRTRRCTG